MFGFLAPRESLPQWRRCYARVCQHQRRFFGLTSLPFLSYEATFLYQVAVDLGLSAALPESAPQCCRLRKIKPSDPNADRELARYAAAFGVTLLGVKLQDDVTDSGSVFSRLLHWKYARQVRRAAKLLTQPVMTEVERAMAEHAQLEASGERDLHAYAAPTGRGFAAVFAATPAGPAIDSDPHTQDVLRETLAEIGECVGRAIICWDCAVDFHRDQIRGDYNPLGSAADVRTALQECVLQLSRIGWLLPAGATSRRVLLSVIRRVQSQCHHPQRDPVKTLERWGILKRPASVYARCDGLDVCCVVGECGECCGAATEVGGACAGCADCCTGPASVGPCAPGCDVCPCVWTDASSKSRQTQAGASPSAELLDYEWCHGRVGQADGVLNPAGYVTIDDQRIPAGTADGRLLESGTQVRVVRTDAFGVQVEAVPD